MHLLHEGPLVVGAVLALVPGVDHPLLGRHQDGVHALQLGAQAECFLVQGVHPGLHLLPPGGELLGVGGQGRPSGPGPGPTSAAIRCSSSRSSGRSSGSRASISAASSAAWAETSELATASARVVPSWRVGKVSLLALVERPADALGDGPSPRPRPFRPLSSDPTTRSASATSSWVLAHFSASGREQGVDVERPLVPGEEVVEVGDRVLVHVEEPVDLVAHRGVGADHPVVGVGGLAVALELEEQVALEDLRLGG